MSMFSKNLIKRFFAFVLGCTKLQFDANPLSIELRSFTCVEVSWQAKDSNQMGIMHNLVSKYSIRVALLCSYQIPRVIGKKIFLVTLFGDRILYYFNIVTNCFSATSRYCIPIIR